MKSFKSAFWLLLMFSQSLNAQVWEFPSTLLPQITDFKACKQKIKAGSMPAKLLLKSGVLRVLQTDTLPENLSLEFLAGKLDVAKNQTLYIEGQVQAGRWAIFSGLGKIVFLPKSTSIPIPQWWGAKADLIQDDQPALQKWVDALGSPSEAFVEGYLPAGKYLVKSPLLLNKVRLQIKGAGRMSSVIVAGTPILAPVIAMANELRITQVSFNANYLAKHALWVADAANGKFEEGACSSAVLDGIYISAEPYPGSPKANNDRIYWNNWDSSGNGFAYYSSKKIVVHSLGTIDLNGSSGWDRSKELGGKIKYDPEKNVLVASKGASFRPRDSQGNLYPSQARQGDVVRLKFEFSNDLLAPNTVYMPASMWVTTHERRIKLQGSKLEDYKLKIGDRLVDKNVDWRIDQTSGANEQEKWLFSEWPQFNYSGYVKTKKGVVNFKPLARIVTVKSSPLSNEFSLDKDILGHYAGTINPGDTLILDNQYRLPIISSVSSTSTSIAVAAPFVQTFKLKAFRIEAERSFLIEEILNDSTARVYPQFKLRHAIPPAEYVIGIGDGVRETYGEDNNINLWYNGFYIGNGGNGRSFQGFYGPNITGGQTDLNVGYGLVLGGFGSNNMLSAEVHSYYLEGNLAGNILLGRVQGCFIGQGIAGSPRPTLDLPDQFGTDYIFMGSLMKEEAFSLSDYRKGIDFSGLLLRKTPKKTLIADEYSGYGYPLFMDTMYFEVVLDPNTTTNVDIEIKTPPFVTLDDLKKKGLYGSITIPDQAIFPEKTLVYDPSTSAQNVSVNINSPTTVVMGNQTVFKAKLAVNNKSSVRQKIKVYPRVE